MSSPAVHRAWLVCTLALIATFALAEPLPTAKPQDVGLSAERLARIGTWVQGEIDAKRIPGAVVLVARNGKVAYYEALGQQDPARPQPMGRDSIFRIYSMTKPLVSVAAMMMVEEGKLLLEAPVARYIPAYANVKVGVEKDDNGGKSLELVAPRRPITVQDLLRHTSGLTYGFFGESLVKRAYNDALSSLPSDPTTTEYAEHFAKLPLQYQPGSTWDYSVSTDVLGRVLEVVDGKSLFTLLKQRLLDPLGMKDTSFYVGEPTRQARIAEPLPDDRSIGVNANIADPRVVRRLESGGGGMVSTADDYARFAQMLLNGGTLDGKRYLSPKTLEYMTSDHLGTAVAKTALYLPGPGYGFGLGFATRLTGGESAYAGAPGDYYWGGAGGTYFWVDPRTNLFVVFMMQSPKQRVIYRSVLRNMVYAAVER
jgi:CubicO group peptidase (beta-lactamase class C family)